MPRSTDSALDYRAIRYPQEYNEPQYSPQNADDELSDESAPSVLDSPENMRLLHKLLDWFSQARTAQAENRYQMALDEDFYDGLQWSEEDKAIVEGRGQPALTFNLISESINWIIGTERRSKIDFSVHPRGKEDGGAAQNKTHLLKYVDDVNKGSFARSRAFKDASVAGLGWLEDGVRADPFDEPLYSRCESWRNIWYDHLAQEPDLSDGRYLFRAKWVDLDLAAAVWPDRADRLRAASHYHDAYGLGETMDDDFLTQLYYRTDSEGRPVTQRTHVDNALSASHQRRSRVRLIEAWYRMPTRGQYVYAEDPQHQRFHKTIFDPQNIEVAQLVDSGVASVYDAIQMRLFSTILCDGALLQAPSSPYRHDKTPFTPVWAYRRARDGSPYSPVRRMRDPQEDLNKRRSKALHILSTTQVFMEEHAVTDKEELREEIADPAGIIEYKRNYKFDVNRDNTLAAQHVEMGHQDEEYIRMAGGVTPENLGHQTNATSGTAIQARQLQGSVTTAELFDNLRYAFQIQGEKRLAIIEQFCSREKTIRILGSDGQDDFVTFNQPGQDAAGAPIIQNPITESQADFVVDAQDYRETIRIAMHEQLMDMIGRLPPEIGLQLLDLVVDMSDVRGREELVRRIRKINGQTDPDAEKTPEGQAAMKEQQQAEAQQAQLQQAALIAEVETQIAKAKQAKADSLVKQLSAFKAAMDTAFAMQQNPTAAPVIEAVIEAAKDDLKSTELTLGGP